MIPYELMRKLAVNKEISVEKTPSAKDVTGQTVSPATSVHPSRLTSDARSVTTKRSVVSPLLPEWYERGTLGVREWIIVIVEISAAYATHIVWKRKSTPEEALRYGKTKRDLEISFLFVQGWAAIGSMVAGIICDCYIGPYALALCSIWVNFLTTSIYLTEEIIKHTIKINPYSEVISNISSLAFIFIKSTDYSRIVFALNNFRSRKQSAVVFLLFILILTGDKPMTGGLLWLITSYLNLSLYAQVMVSFYSSGISLILLHLVHRPTSQTEFSYIARKVIQSLVLTTLRSLRLYRELVNPLGYKAFDGRAAATTRDLMILFSLILPTVGYFFYLTGIWSEGNLWEAFVNQSEPPGLYQYTGVATGLQIMIYLSMIITFFVLRPLSTLAGIKQNSHHFFLGYLVSLFVCWYSTGVAKAYEPAGSLQGLGHIRILNTREDEVQIITDDNKISKKNFTINSHGSIMWSLPVYRKSLLRTILIFNETDQLSTHLEVTPKKCVAYVLLDPSEVVRVKGYIPLWMGVPEAHSSSMARFYVFTAARSFANTKFTLLKLDSRDALKKDGPLEPGNSFVFEVPPGKYSVNLQKFNVEEKLEVGPGSVSGIVFYSDYRSGRIIIDKVIKGMVASSLFITGFGLGFGFSMIFGYVSFVYMAFNRAPQGFLATTFGYLSFQENLSYWILLIGFRTWHDQVTSYVLMIYSFFISILFFLCIFIYMKYTQL